jgi:hypothetical protein
MIDFKLDELGNKIEYDQHTRIKGQARLYVCECNKCGKLHNYPIHVNFKTKRCSCRGEKDLLTHEGVTKPLKKWAEDDESVNLRSARVRLSDRDLGKRDCTDTEVLYGFHHAKSVKNSIKVKTQYEWRKTFVHEFGKRVNRLSLLDAIFESVLIASDEKDFCAEKKFDFSKVLTPFGLTYLHGGESLQSIYDMLEDVEAVKQALLDDGMTAFELSKLFK